MFGKITGYQVEKQTVQLQFDAGEIFAEVLREDIVNIFVPYMSKEHRSKAIEGSRQVPTEFTVKQDETGIAIQTAALQVKVSDGGYVDFYDGKGNLFCADYRGKRIFPQKISETFKQLLASEGHDVSNLDDRDYPVQCIKVMDGDEKFYGLGDKSGFLNKRHYAYENWNSDLPQAHNEDFRALYKSIPFLIAKKEQAVFGLFFDNTFHSYMNLGKENEKYYFYGADGGNLDYYLISGQRMPDVVSGYTWLTGTTPLPQLWTLGYQQTRWGYECTGDVREVAEKYRALRIPCDTIMFDIDYMDGYRVFTWNDKMFGEPGSIVKEIAAKGFKSVAIIDPGVKVDEAYEMYQEGMANDYFAKTPEGEAYVNAVWPGKAVYPDFGKPAVRDWWGKKQQYLTGLGFCGTWNDMNEPASFNGELPGNVMFTEENRPMRHEEMHNVYGHYMAKATYEGLKKADGKRPFVITRACYAGTQKYATVWTGDNQSLWHHLQMAIPQLCNLGMSGVAFAGTDVGGFGADCTPELLCRWVQVGAFSPLFRNHSAKGSRRQEPWQFDEQTIAINRKFIELRYRLLPYFYDLFRVCEESGLPIIRPLVLHYEDDPEVWNLNGEFLVGEQLLIAPVVEQGATRKLVYLPEGIWYDFETGKAFEGKRYYIVEAPLDTCPMFVKEGTILPTYEVMQYVGERPYDTLRLLVYPGAGTYIHYQDNGSDFAYRDGAYNLYEFTSDAQGQIRQQMLHEGYVPYRDIEIIRK